MPLNFEQIHDTIQVIADNRKVIGHIETAIDGYRVFWPNTHDGCWEAHYLREIADKLDELNKEWDWVIKNDPSIPALPCETCGHTSYERSADKSYFACRQCGALAALFECFECGGPIVNAACAYCEKERQSEKENEAQCE